MTARTSQAALAVNTPDGRSARAEFFRSAWTFQIGVDAAPEIGWLVRGGGRKQGEDLVVPDANIVASGDHFLPEHELELGDHLARRRVVRSGALEIVASCTHGWGAGRLPSKPGSQGQEGP